MKIKIHEREKKAMVRFTHPAEIQWFKRHMAFIRDSDPKTHPPITLKNDDGNVRIPKPKPMPMPPIKIGSSGQVMPMQPNGQIQIDPKIKPLPPPIKPKDIPPEP